MTEHTPLRASEATAAIKARVSPGGASVEVVASDPTADCATLTALIDGQADALIERHFQVIREAFDLGALAKAHRLALANLNNARARLKAASERARLAEDAYRLALESDREPAKATQEYLSAKSALEVLEAFAGRLEAEEANARQAAEAELRQRIRSGMMDLRTQMHQRTRALAVEAGNQALATLVETLALNTAGRLSEEQAQGRFGNIP